MGSGDAPGTRAHRWTTRAIRAQGASSLGRGLAVVGVLLGLSWLISYSLGGAGRVPPHWFYVPILVAAARFGLPGAAATAVVAGLIAGPLLPLDVPTGAPQHVLDWSARLGFFVGIGLVVGSIIVRLRSSLDRELALAHEDRDLALREGEQRTRSIIETASEAVVGMDASGLITDWNRAAQDTFGWSREEAIGRDLADTVMPERYREAHRNGLERFLATGEGPVLNTRIELEALHKEGHEFPVELTITALRAGGSVSFIAFVHDITERKRAEQELRRAKEEAERTEREAEQANQAKSEFLSRMSHELRTPLNAILGFGQLLKMEGLEPGQEESVQQILKGGKHLLDLINEVLDIARIESGRITLSLEPIALAEALREAQDLIGPIAAEDGIELRTGDSWPHDLYVDADGQRLKQVLLNLLTNAVKYNRPGGSVTVCCNEIAGNGLRLEITDEGPGIPPEMMDRLFVPFERLGADGTGAEGTGLGLALSKRLTEAMGGTLGVQSTPGGGSTFFIELPLAQPRWARGQRAEVDRQIQSATPARGGDTVWPGASATSPQSRQGRHLAGRSGRFPAQYPSERNGQGNGAEPS